ncbi:glycosyltransferase [uncultured Shimia sp.]|uniref:glycosyltransferase n=1 Tax=uncultured Shimia sp. TaxID=573152 RepID=UPI0026182490|nr:glycosyltransferase [uncultured Shimia sp.]
MLFRRPNSLSDVNHTVTHIITGLNVGGAERALYTLLTNGLEGPFRNRVISLMGPGHYGPLLQEAGIPVTCLHMSPGKPTPGALRRLLATVSGAQTEILQGWMLHGNLAATLARRWANRDAVLLWNQRTSLDAFAEETRIKRGLIRLEARLSTAPRAIIYNSARSRRQFTEHGYNDERALHLPNGFDTGKWAPNAVARSAIRKELDLPRNARVIGYVGRGHPEKDPALLFQAFSSLHQRHRDAWLLAIGRNLDKFNPPEQNSLLLGQRSDVQDLMCVMDIFCLSSRTEGFPNVIGEAMATGLPCVTTDVGDARDIVGDTGWVAPPRNPERLAARLDEALSCSDEKLRDRGKRARARIISEFSISSVVDRYVSLYRSVAKEGA